jgi:hypothetical protein
MMILIKMHHSTLNNLLKKTLSLNSKVIKINLKDNYKILKKNNIKQNKLLTHPKIDSVWYQIHKLTPQEINKK